MSTDKKNIINKIIYERAYEIESMLSDDDFFLAKLCGVSILNIEDVSLRIAIKELQKEFSK